MEREELLKLIKKGSITHNYLLDHAEELTKDEVVKEYVTQTGLDLEKDKDTAKEDTAKEDTAKEDTAKEDATKEDTAKEDTAKEDTAKEDATKEDATKEDTTKEDATKEDATKEDATKEDTATEKADIKVPDEDGIVVDPVASTPKKTRKTQNKK